MSHHSSQWAGHITACEILLSSSWAQRRTGLRKSTKINVHMAATMRAGRESPNSPGSRDYSVLLVPVDIPQLLRKDPKCSSIPAAPAASLPALISDTTRPLHQSLTKHKRIHQKKHHNSRAVNSRHIARRCLGTWQQNKPDSRSCDKSETSSHLITVHVVYELTYYFTWHTHSIPDEHRANKPLKDSCELYKYWNQTLARYQPSEMQTGTHTDLHWLKPSALKRSHHVHTWSVLMCCSISTKLFHWFGIQQFGDQTIKLRFSSSLGKLPGCLTEGWREAPEAFSKNWLYFIW